MSTQTLVIVIVEKQGREREGYNVLLWRLRERWALGVDVETITFWWTALKVKPI